MKLKKLSYEYYRWNVKTIFHVFISHIQVSALEEIVSLRHGRWWMKNLLSFGGSNFTKACGADSKATVSASRRIVSKE